MINYFKDLYLGFKILISKKFWKAFLKYYSADEISKRLDQWGKGIK